MLEAITRCLVLMLLLWLPLPFGSVTGFAQLPLASASAVILILVSLIPQKASGGETRRSIILWGSIFVAWGLLQWLPLGHGVVSILSPRAGRLCESASEIHALLAPHDGFRPCSLSVNPSATLNEIVRGLAYLSLFYSSGLVFRSARHRSALFLVCAVSVLFQTTYGVQAWTSGTRWGTHSVWGWHNARIFGRLTGTFVNPNHFAAYLAMLAPLAVVLLFTRSRRESAGLLAGNRAYALGTGFLALLAIGSGILLSQSRAILLIGLMLVPVTVMSIATVVSSGGWKAASRWGLASLAMLGILGGAMIGYLGTERTVTRLMAVSDGASGGRITGFKAALALWRQYPVFGSGLGTFDDLVLSVQEGTGVHRYNHAHNDYFEVAATAGLPGLCVLVLLVAAVIRLYRDALRNPALRRNDRLFLIGVCLAAAVIALHSLADFDLFIPAIPATLAVLLGAATAIERKTTDEGTLV